MRTARDVDSDPYRSAPAVKIAQWVRDYGLMADEEYSLPSGHRLDIYLPELHGGIEVNGPHHHRKHDAERAEGIFRDFAIPLLDVPIGIAKEPFYCFLIEFIVEWTETASQRQRFFDGEFEATA